MPAINSDVQAGLKQKLHGLLQIALSRRSYAYSITFPASVVIPFQTAKE